MLGVALVLVALGWPRHGDGRRGRLPLAAAAMLLALFGGMAGVGLATGGLSGQHQQAHLDSTGAAAVSTVLNTPTFAALQTTLHEQGTPAALDQLEALASNDRASWWSHMSTPMALASFRWTSTAAPSRPSGCAARPSSLVAITACWRPT